MDCTSDHDAQMHIVMTSVWKVQMFPTFTYQFKNNFPKLSYQFTGYKNKLLSANLNLSDESFWFSSSKKNIFQVKINCFLWYLNY